MKRGMNTECKPCNYGLQSRILTESEGTQYHGQVLSCGISAWKFDLRCQDPTQVVPGVEEQEAGDGGEIGVGPGVSGALVLRLDQDGDTREDCQGGQEYEEDTEQIFPSNGQAVPVAGGGGGGDGVHTDRLVPRACVMSEEGCSLYGHECHQTEYHK